MRFAMPKYPCEFELPDEWWVEAGMVGFAPVAQAYRSTAPATLVSLVAIEPPARSPATPKDWQGFDRERLVSILKGIASEAEIEPVPLMKLPTIDDYSSASYGFRVRNGYHRFYASIAAGFPCLPAVIS